MKNTSTKSAAKTSTRGNHSGSRSGSSGGSSSRKTSNSESNSNSNGNPGSATAQQGQQSGTAQSNGNGKAESSLLGKFLLDQLKDIYYAENQIAKALPKMEEAATSEELKEAFDDHLHQTQKHIKRLEKAFQAINQKPEGKKCEAIEGITRECDSIISETPQGTHTRDAALILAAQKIEHYEIATYGGLVQLALTMEMDEVADLLDRTLMEEEDTDMLLTNIAEESINFEAEQEGAEQSGSEEEEEEEKNV